MVYKITFEADVNGLASVQRVNGEIYVYGKDVSTARHYAEGYCAGSYGENYVILTAVPLPVMNME